MKSKKAKVKRQKDSIKFKIFKFSFIFLIFYFLLFTFNFCYAQDVAGKTDLSGGLFDYVCKMRGEFGVKSDEVLGDNKRVFLGGSLSDETYSIKTCIEQREFLTEGITVGIDLQESLLNDDRYTQVTPSAGVYVYADMDKDTRFSTELKYSQPEIYHLSDTADPAIRRYDKENQVATVLFRCENEPVDDKDYPRAGRKSDLSLEVSSESLGSDFNFLRAKAQNAFYYTPKKWIFEKGSLNDITFVLNGQAGLMKEFGGDDEIPFFERFFAGGTDTVRGYRPRYLAPRDSENLPIGGDCMLALNAEMRYPVYKDIKGAVFYDQGNAWNKLRDIDLSDTKAGVGTGLRWVTSLGVARLDYGYGLNGNTRQSGGRVHLSLGMEF